MAILQEAVRFGRRVDAECLRVVGHSDLTGTTERRQLISRLRAETVARELVRLGSPEACIIVQACGDRFILVPTPDVVAEVQNRRVDILHEAKAPGPGFNLGRLPSCPGALMADAPAPAVPTQ